jgi:hypothetical protein
MRSLVFVFVIVIMLTTSACGNSRKAVNTPAAINHTRLQLRCEPQSTLLQCQALASETTNDIADTRDVTQVVRWTSSNQRALVVDSGRIRAERGATAVVTATWTEIAGTPSASVVVAGGPNGEARQAYVIEGEVRRFPSAEGVPGARVTLIEEAGGGQTVIASSSHDDAAGHFRFLPVAPGRYQVRAVREGYRSTQMAIAVPDDMPRTITLLPETH